MPKMTGAQATRALRAMGFEGTIIGITGDPMGSHDRDDFQGSGVDFCIDKDSAGVERIVHVLRGFARRAY